MIHHIRYAASPHSSTGECVVLLHGLARTSKSMEKMSARLVAAGYNTINVDYESRRHPIEALSDGVLSATIEVLEARSCTKAHFVTHSLGGILVRQFLETKSVPRLGRVVMLGPPHHGSEVVDRLRNFEFFRKLNGPAGSQLGTDRDSVPNRLKRVDFELGVIAGDRSINWINSLMIAGADDGKVSVESTKVEGMTDHAVLHATHPMMMRNDQVIEHVVRFLRTGSFGGSKRLTFALVGGRF